MRFMFGTNKRPPILPPANIQPWKQQVAFNTNAATDITGFSALGTDASPYAVNSPMVAIYKNFIYVGGGNDATPTWTNVLYRAPISAGVIGTWTSIGTIPVADSGTQFIVIKNKLWIIGGQINGTSNAMTPNTWYATINADGSLSSWTAGPALNTKRGRFSVWLNYPYIYVGGGLSPDGNTAIATVERALINSDGTLGAWAFTSNLAVAMSDHTIFDTGTRIYLVGGFNGSIQSTGMWAAKNGDGSMGSWTNGAMLPAVNFFADGFCTQNEAFYIGGYQAGFTPTATIYRAPINGSGVIGSFTAGTSMPAGRTAARIALTSTRVYVIGGYSGANMVTHAAFTGGLDDYSGKV